MMLSFEEMILRCIDDDARSHIREAVRCYEAGAYRAAIVAAYVAVCFDLIAKLRSLAAEGDAEATARAARLDNLQQQERQGDRNAVKGLLEFERDLLELFRDKFEFFGQQEFDELSRLRADRNRCAHPTFFHDAQPYTPAAEMARLHIRSALVYVLSQRPRQGRAALEGLRTLIKSRYFPSKVEDAVKRLRGGGLGGARDALVRSFVDDVAFGWPDAGHPYYQCGEVIIALKAAVELHRPIAIPRIAAAIEKLTAANDDLAMTFAGALAIQFEEASDRVGEAGRAALCKWIEVFDEPIKAHAVQKALAMEWWADAATAALATLTEHHFEDLEEATPEILHRAAQLYCSARDWQHANALAPKVVVPFVDQFTRDHLEYIFTQARNGADLIGSHSFRQFINLLYEKNAIDRAELSALLGEHGLEYYVHVEGNDADGGAEGRDEPVDQNL